MVAQGNKYFNNTCRRVFFGLPTVRIPSFLFMIEPKQDHAPLFTTTAGNPVADHQNSVSAGPRACR